MSGLTIITDGQGEGQSAGVNSKNRLKVAASTFSNEHLASLSGDAYFANITDTDDALTLADGNTYWMLYLKNGEASRNLIVEKVLHSHDATNGVLIMKWIKNPALGSISNANTHVPANLNFGSNKTAQGTFYNWDEVGTGGITGLSGGTTVKTFITRAGFNIMPIDAAIVMPPSSSFAIQLINNTGGNVEAECAVRMYYEEGIV